MSTEQPTGILDRIARATARRPWLVVLLLLLSLIPALSLASRLTLETSFTELLPADYPAVRDLRAGIAKTGGSAFAVVAIGAQDLPVAQRFADAVAAKLETLDVVRYAQARIEMEFIKDRRLLYLDRKQLRELREQIADEIDLRTAEAGGLVVDLDDDTAKTSSGALDLEARFERELELRNLPFKEYLVGKDGKYLYIFLSLRGDTGDMAFARQAQASVEETVRKVRDEGGFPKDLDLRFTGSLVIRIEEDEALKKDLSNASVIGFVAVVLLLVVFTRRIRALVLLSLPLLLGLSWTFAFAWIAIGRLNIISGFLASILSGLGIEFSIHLLLRYLEERGQGRSVDAANAVSLRNTGRSLFGSALTNAGAFFVVSFAGFQGFSEFGVIAGAGMLITLLFTLLMFPAINVALERIRPMKPSAPHVEGGGIHVPAAIRWFVLISMVAFAAVSIQQLVAGKVRYRTNWREMKGRSPAADFDDYMIQSLGGSFTQSLVLTSTLNQIPEVAEAIDTVREKRKQAGLGFGVTKLVSLYDLVPPDQIGRLEEIGRINSELTRIDRSRLGADERNKIEKALRLTEIGPFTVKDVPRSLKQRFETRDGSGSLVVLSTDYTFYESAQIMSWADQMLELRGELDRRGITTPIISENWIAGTVFKIISSDGPFVLGATFLVVFVILVIDFRNLKRALIVLGSLAIGLVSVAGAMGIFGIELNFMNSAIVPIIVGVSIDNAVHIYHRYLEEGPASIPKVLRYTVVATSLSSATNLLGFGAMIVANHHGLRSVGELAVIGILLTFFSTSVFFPLALDQWSRFRPTGQATPVPPSPQ